MTRTYILMALSILFASIETSAQSYPRLPPRIYVTSNGAASRMFQESGLALPRVGAPDGIGIAAADVTADGVEDIVVLGRDASSVAVFDPVSRHVVRSFALSSASPAGVAVGDVTDAFANDIVLVDDVGGGIQIYNLYSARPRSLIGRGVAVAVGNYDGAEGDEIFTLESTGAVVVRDASGRILTTRSSGLGPRGAIAVGDLNGDGRENEIVVVSAIGASGVAVIDASGRVSYRTGMGVSVAIGDIDNDGDKEILVGESEGAITVRDTSGAFLRGAGGLVRTITSGLSNPAIGIGGHCAVTADRLTNADGDALPDQWEDPGIDLNDDCVVDLPVGSIWSASPRRRDLFVEIDFMSCAAPGSDCPAGDTHEHRFLAPAITIARNTFANAPLANPDGSRGVDLHVYIDEAVPHQMNCGWGCVHALKRARFGDPGERRILRDFPSFLAIKRQFFHYSVWVHNQAAGESSSGYAEITGNDFMVSLGSWTAQVGTTADQAGTFLHELGHNLNLGHGGSNDDNCKPNYLSIMSYTYQVTGLQPGGVFDFSRTALPTLDEDSLDETAGIGDGAFFTFFGPLSDIDNFDQGMDGILNDDLGIGRGMGSIDWSLNRVVTRRRVSRDLNNLGFSGCGGEGSTLTGFDDWTNMLFDIRGYDGLRTGGRTSGLELTFAAAQQMKARMERAIASRAPTLPGPRRRDLGPKIDPLLPPIKPEPSTRPTKPKNKTELRAEDAARLKEQMARAQGIRASGQLSLRVGANADLDDGKMRVDKTADIFLEDVPGRGGYLTPRNGATFALGGSSPKGKSGCAAAKLSKEPVSLSKLTVGTYVCVKTDKGRLAELRIDAVEGGGKSLSLSFATWEIRSFDSF